MRPLVDRQIYEIFTADILTRAESFIWIATANLKSTGVFNRGKYLSFVDLMSLLGDRGVSFRIIHADLPSAPFRERYETLDGEGRLSDEVEFLHCIRMHAKLFIVDGKYALAGSPNLTGAGIGAKSRNNRNFEIAFLFEGESETSVFMQYFDYIWMGGPCPKCGRRKLCPAPAA